MLKVGIKLPEELEHPLVTLTAYSDYPIQVGRLTLVTLPGVHY